MRVVRQPPLVLFRLRLLRSKSSAYGVGFVTPSLNPKRTGTVCTQRLGMHKPPKRIEVGSLVSEACLGAMI
jgi:hypothetical protein